ncbi:MAG: isochorismatase family protein [Planctomycetes bacterium]|nr:isochorismatase family protein [Planctomycetota bacterium]
MKNRKSKNNYLISAADSILIIIDVQEHFIKKLAEKDGKVLIDRIGWLVELAKRLNIPLVVTAEDIPNSGGVAPSLKKKLPPNAKVYNKMSFGLAADKKIMSAIGKTHRKTAILVGLETDVCIYQSAIGLLGLGFKVVVPEEAVASPGNAHKLGIERMKTKDVNVISIKSLYYEWVRTVQNDKKLISALGLPAGIKL